MAKRQAVAIRPDDTVCDSKVRRSPGAFELEEHIFYLFGQVCGRRNRDLAEIFRQFGLSNPKFRVLTALTDGDGLPICALADITVVERTTLSRALDQMEADGLVRRVPNDADKRTIEVWLTPAGRRRLNQVWPRVVAETDRAVAGLSDTEIARLKTVLRKIIGNLRPNDE